MESAILTDQERLFLAKEVELICIECLRMIDMRTTTGVEQRRERLQDQLDALHAWLEGIRLKR